MQIDALSEEAKLKLNSICPGCQLGQVGTKLEALCGFMRMFSEKETPKNAIAATGLITITAAANDNTVTIGDVTYTFKTALSSEPTKPNEVLIGSTANDSAANLVLAIKAEGTVGEVGVKYSTGTVPHPLVTASASNNQVTVTAQTKGAAGNDIDLAKSGNDLAVSGAKLGTGTGATAGVDGTPGTKGDLRIDDTYLYRLKADQDTSGTNWVRLGTFGDYNGDGSA